MALTIAVVNLKGGAGKTTLVVTMGVCLHRAGHRVLLVDTDEQGSLAIWAHHGEAAGADNPRVVTMDGRDLRQKVRTAVRDVDVIIIDTPPRLAVAARAAILVSDLVVVPTIPGGPDVWALHSTLEVVEEARRLRPELRAVVVPNRVDRTVLARLTLESLEGVDAEVLDVGLGARVAVGEALVAGHGVIDYAEGSKAALEATAVTETVLATLKR